MHGCYHPLTSVSYGQGVFYARQTRPNELVPGPPEGCALLTRSERLNVLDSRAIRCVQSDMMTTVMGSTTHVCGRAAISRARYQTTRRPAHLCRKLDLLPSPQDLPAIGALCR
jgi:hypothetical protein